MKSTSFVVGASSRVVVVPNPWTDQGSRRGFGNRLRFQLDFGDGEIE